ncbi:hypothetical protein D1AOALGA4SA_3251 [Olavius algarvensis Delta 1 endosymbiont]|nr:hypothetical protein D1AOALGA4SA_3251 [Olavius algarvensis Delta 1 endosymbiont]
MHHQGRPNQVASLDGRSPEPFYFVAENLVLWARSEPLGYAVNLLQAEAE